MSATIYEMRVYRCLPGRLPALLARFEATTLDLWKRHGIEPAGFWTTEVGASHLDVVYMLRWNSMAERETKWGAFTSDPEWIAKRTESEKDGPILANIVNSFLKPTAFSNLK